MAVSQTTLPRRAAAAALIAAPLAGLAASQVWPDNPPDPAARLDVIAGNTGRYLAGNLLSVLAIVLFIGALVTMLHLLRGPRPRLSRVGGVLAALGIVGWSGITAVSAIELEMAKAADRSSMVALAERIQSNPVAGVFLVMFLLGLFIGLIVIAVGLWRAGVAPVWTPIAVVAAVALDVVASTEQTAVALVWTLLTLALGWVAVRVLRTPDEEWARGPAPAQTSKPRTVAAADA